VELSLKLRSYGTGETWRDSKTQDGGEDLQARQEMLPCWRTYFQRQVSLGLVVEIREPVQEEAFLPNEITGQRRYTQRVITFADQSFGVLILRGKIGDSRIPPWSVAALFPAKRKYQSDGSLQPSSSRDRKGGEAAGPFALAPS
jgi:hypothetical protein